MKRKSVLFSILLMFLLVSVSMVNADEHCGIVEFSQKLIDEHPELEPAIERSKYQLKEETRAFSENAATRAVLRAPIVIPVVVHVIHANGPENIPDAKVIEGIEQVNEDFKMLNADPALIHPNFQGLATDTQMIFRLAKLDPNGNPTNGITRTYNPTWSANGAADESNMKLTVGWPQHQYLNVYVVTSAYGGNSSAYAHYPSSVQPPWEHYDGITISAWAYGRTTPGYYTILTHEIGHWANLIHTWGDKVGAGLSTSCNIDDEVADTPNCIGDWGTQCNVNTTSCGSMDNNENFMDYGQCQTMFTAGQVTRIHAAMNSSIGRRNEIWQQSNLIATGVYETNYTPTGKINGEYYGTNGVAVIFTSKGSYDIDGSISSYQWSFGDGTTSTAADPTHTYNTTGEFQVALTVTDNGGKSSTTTTTAYITSPGTYITTETEPNDNFNTANGPIGSTAFPVSGNFTALESDYYYFTVQRPGKISITLTAADTSATVTWTLYHESDLVNYVAYPSKGGFQSVGDFEATQTGKYYLVSYITSSNPSNYTLEVIYPGGVVTGGNKSPIAVINGPYSGSLGSAINFSSAGSNDPDGTIVSYEWNFGDGNTSTVADPTHTYANAGTFTVTLKVTDDQGATGTATTEAVITDGNNLSPTANANGPYSGAVNSAINFSSAGSNDPDGTIVSYEWNFGDGNTSTAANPTHTYAAAGTFTVTLKVTDDRGAIGTATTTANITGGTTNITAETEPNDSSAEANGPMGFGLSVSGSLGTSYDKDWFYFDVTSPRTLNISGTLTGGTEGTWQLFHESNLSNYVAYPTSGLNGSYDAAQTGRYYLMMYTWGAAGNLTYTLMVQ